MKSNFLKIITLIISIVTLFPFTSYSQEPDDDLSGETIIEDVQEEEVNHEINLMGIFDIAGSFRLTDGAQDELGNGEAASVFLNLLGIRIGGYYSNFGAEVFYVFNQSFHYLDEGYAYAKLPFGDTRIKVGLVKQHFGLQSDNSWLLSYIYYTGITFDSDYGILYDGTYELTEAFNLNIQAGYFVLSNGYNGSRYGGPQDLSIELNGEERNSFTGKLQGNLNLDCLTLWVEASAIGGQVKVKTETEELSSRYLMYGGGIDLKIKLFDIDDFIWIIGEVVQAELDMKDRIPVLTNYFGWMVGLAVRPLNDCESGWIDWLNIHLNYGMIDRETGTTTDLFVGGVSIGFTDYLIYSIEYTFGHHDIWKSLFAGGNRFDDGIYVSLIYLLNI